MGIKRILIATLMLTQIGFSSSAQSIDELNAEIAEVDMQLAEVETTIENYNGGLIRTIAELRRESLLLSRVLLNNRVLAIEGEEQIEVVVPAVLPNEAKAEVLLGEIADAQRRVEESEREAETTGGLIQALTLSRVETEKLTLAQLQMAYFQAQYGIAFPTPGTLPETDGNSVASSNRDPDSTRDENIETLPWADLRYPHVDYSLVPFTTASVDDDSEISGWWTVKSSHAAIDDSPQITAINYSAYNPGSFSGLTALIARCTEGKTALIFVQDDFLISDYRRNSFDITYRVDNHPAEQARWASLTSNKGAGLFGAGAESFIRQIYNADQLFVRLTEKNGQRHDVTFDLSGGQDAFDEVSSACGWTTLSLSSDDYRSIQTLLNAGGFDAGTPDGVWGAGSQRAMKAFQASVGLPETGAPDRATITQLGLD